jgi:DNA polymerase III delta prime subunit
MLNELQILSIEDTNFEEEVWDLSVPNTNNFFIGEQEVLTHTCDYLSHDAQALLRSLMEEVSDSCRFLGTANYVNKILPAIQDRFQIHTLSKPDRDSIALRLSEILEKEKIEFEVDDLLKVVEAGYPSIRNSLHMLEAGSQTGKLVLQGASSGIQDWKLQLLPLLEASDLKGARKLVCESASREELQDVYRFLYDNIHRVPKLKAKEDQAVITIAQYQYQHAFVSDVEIQIAALFIELGAL